MAKSLLYMCVCSPSPPHTHSSSTKTASELKAQVIVLTLTILKKLAVLPSLILLIKLDMFESGSSVATITSVVQIDGLRVEQQRFLGLGYSFMIQSHVHHHQEGLLRWRKRKKTDFLRLNLS
uniref:Uncharacterized protein n=1 Tax=Sphaerodactylus townsendi TaxID=933632 RepID=A0ACB8F457_9SAUR